jgi:hypothetical protein
MRRTSVYKLLDGEREYQNNLPPSRTDYVERTVGDYITMMGHYYNKMVEAWTVNPGDEQALDVMRKIGGIAVHCMEDHGAPPRVVPVVAKETPKKKAKVSKLKSTVPPKVPYGWPFPIDRNG